MVSELVSTLLTNIYYGFNAKFIRMDVLEESMIAHIEKEWSDINWASIQQELQQIASDDDNEYFCGDEMKSYVAVKTHPRIFPVIKFCIGMLLATDPDLLDDNVMTNDICNDVVCIFKVWIDSKK
jgi:hypothetical protein